MATLSADERAALKDSVHRLLADRSTEADVRGTMETESGYDAALWTQLSEMGIAGLVIDEAHGGAGAGPLELEAVMEEAGAALLCAPLRRLQRARRRTAPRAGRRGGQRAPAAGHRGGDDHRHRRADRRGWDLDRGQGVTVAASARRAPERRRVLCPARPERRRAAVAGQRPGWPAGASKSTPRAQA